MQNRLLHSLSRKPEPRVKRINGIDLLGFRSTRDEIHHSLSSFSPVVGLSARAFYDVWLVGLPPNREENNSIFPTTTNDATDIEKDRIQY